MKRRVMIASLMALAMLTSPVGGLNSMLRVSAEEEPGLEMRSVTGNASETEEDTEKVQLNAPIVFDWGDISSIPVFPNAKYTIWWDGGNIEEDGIFNWEIEFYKDGEPYFSEIQPCRTFPKLQFHFTFRDQVSESGTYKFRIRAVAASGDEIYRDSEWSRWSEEITYVRPEQELGVVSGYWDAEKTGIFHFEQLDISESLLGDVQYIVRLYGQGQGDKACASKYISANTCKDSAVVDVDFSDAISQNGGDRYYVTVQADSRNIDVMARGAVGPESGILDTTSRSDNSAQRAENSSQGKLESGIAAAASGTTVKVTRDENINTLSNSVMQQLVKRGDVALEMEYTYEGVDYHVIIPAGEAVDNEIAWYGPLYLAAHYSVANTGSGNSVPAYIVQQGDTLGKIARDYHTTVARLAAANPQIRNVNRITAGQVISID